MNSREQTLALVLLGAILLTVGAVGGYLFVWQPLQKQGEAAEALTKEITDLEAQSAAQAETTRRLAVARVRSLPADEALARREYTVALERLIEGAGIPKGYTISPKSVDNSARSVPEIAKGKPVYTRVAYEVVFKKADMWAVKDFLQGYYQLGLLHQITAVTIKKDEDPGSKNAGRRNDLTVTLTTEAILVDGADARRTLLPVPTAFAAIGGAAMYRGMAATPEAGRGVVPQILVPVLAPSARDYSLLVQKDPFNGPLPAAPPFKLAKIADVKVNPNERPAPVKVAVSGDGAYGARVTATAAGSLFAEGALKVDPKTLAVELPRPVASAGTATVSVVATSSDGKATEKASFKVSLEAPTEVAEKEDISAFVVLIGVAPRSDGTAWARITDNVNRYRYQIDAGPTGIKVAKEEIFISRRGWEAVDDHKHPPGVMVISDKLSKTHRTLQVIAVDGDGLVVADLKPDGSGAPAKAPWPPRPGAPAKPGPANPLAAVGGNMIAAGPPAPKYYRWGVGQSLLALKAIPEDEAKKIIKQADAAGPVSGVAAATP